MNLKDMVDRTLLLVSQTAGVTLPRIVVALAGLTLCVWLVSALWARRLRALAAVPGILGGLLLVGMALDSRVLHWLVATSDLTRIRLLMALLSLLVVAVTFEAIRRSHLRERYALLWLITGGLVLLFAAFPGLLTFLSEVLHVQYVTAVVIVVFTALLLVVFHFSLALSGLLDDRTRLAQTCARLEERLRQLEARLGAESPPAAATRAADADQPAASPRRSFLTFGWPGTKVAALLLALAAVLAVLGVGLATSQPLIGDEVTHYHMLTRQARELPVPNYYADIPTGWGDTEVRRYPHPNLWHYAGAWLFRLTGGSFAAVQLYQALFLAQLLWVAYRWASARGGLKTRASLLYVLSLASLPMTLIFSVAFYQDVPLAAQALTAFYLLDRRRPILATVFLCCAVAIKTTGAVFVPPFVVLLALWAWRGGPAAGRSAWRRAATGALCLAVMLLAIHVTGWSLKRYTDAGYYPADELRKVAERVVERVRSVAAPRAAPVPPAATASLPAPDVRRYEVIANHPGDLRNPANFLVYGGILLWVVAALGLAGAARRRGGSATMDTPPSGLAPACVGAFYLAVVAYQLRTAPDARFFLPGVAFLLLPLAESAVRWPSKRLLPAVLTAVAVLQSGHVLAKTLQLRQVPEGVQEAIAVLRATPPEPNRIFMYPEGNYRLFPAPHDWYLDYRLRDFWKAPQSQRRDMLRDFHIGAVVVKKHLVGDLDPAMNNLGIYPRSFVADLESDPAFRKVLDNRDAAVYYLSP